MTHDEQPSSARVTSRHHGYFIPRANPDVKGASFPGLGYDGPSDVAVALFTFPGEEVYRNYREAVAADPECQAMAALVRETRCFTRYERLFLQPVKPLAQSVAPEETLRILPG